MEMKITKTKREYYRDAEQSHITEMEKQWRNLQTRFTSRELSKIFPAVKKIIPGKIKELEGEREEFMEIIRDNLRLIKGRVIDPFSKYFWREWVKYNQVFLIVDIDKQLDRFRRLENISQNKNNYKKSKFSISDEDIQKAREIPIIDIALQYVDQIRRVGENHIGLCPFHKEKNPSFYIYSASNNYHCYGCGAHGDLINLIMELHGFSFIEAVQFLLRG